MLGEIKNMALGKYLKPFEQDIPVQKADPSGFLGNLPFGGGDKKNPNPSPGSGYYQLLINTRNKTKPRVEDYRGSWGVVNKDKVGENDSEIYNFMNTKSMRNASYFMDGKQTTFDAKEGEGGLDRVVGDNYRMLSIPIDKINDPEYAPYLEQMKSNRFGSWDDNIANIDKQLSKYSR